MSEWVFFLVQWIVSLWAIGFAVCFVGCAVILYIDQEIGFYAFREWAARRLWRDLAMWCFHPVFMLDLLFAAALMNLVWTYRLWRARRRARTGYRTRW